MEEETNVRGCPQPSGPSVLEFFSYLLNMLLHKQQQVIEVTKGERRHLEIFKIKEDIHIYSHFFNIRLVLYV